MKKKKFLLILTYAIILGMLIYKGYQYAYEKGKTDEFNCKITNGRWVEKDTDYGDLGNGIHWVDKKGCYEKSDAPFRRK